jgi:hypothetical protein
LYGRPVAQPCFDFPNWARFSDCRPGPLPWGYDVFPDYGPIDCGGCDLPYSVACPGDWVAHRPSTWYAIADFAPLTIDHLDSYAIARIGPTAAAPAGPVVLRTDDLRPEFDAGGKFTIGRRIFDCYRLEGTYLGSYDWSDSVLVTNTDLSVPGTPAIPGIDNSQPPDGDFLDAVDVAPVPATPPNPASIGNLSTFLSGFSDPATAGLDQNTRVMLAFESSMQSGEINLRYWADLPPGPFDVSYLVGARFFQINEQYNFIGQAVFPAVVTNDALVITENEMIGVQLGIHFAWLKSTRWWFECDLKGGMYNNRINLTTSFIETVPGDATETGAAITRDRTAWVGDFAVACNWQMTPNWTFRFGYQALFMNGLALGNDNLVANADLFGLNEARLDDSGELAYHGPTIGLIWMR